MTDELMPRETVVSKDQAPKRLRFELVNPVEGEPDGVLVKSKTINKRDEIIHFSNMKPLPRSFFVNKIIRRERTVPKFFLGLIPRGTKTRVDFLVRCNQYWSESLGSLTEQVPTFSRELENLLLSDEVKQHIEAVGKIKKFVIDSGTIKLMLIVFALGLPFALLIDSALGLIPNQVVIWAP